MDMRILKTTFSAALLAAGFAALAGCGDTGDAPVFRDQDPVEPAEPAVPPSPPGNPPGALPNGNPGADLGANAPAGGAANGIAGGWAATSENLLGRADLMPTEGNEAAGTVTFERTESGGVTVHAVLTGLSAGPHGFHVHENGDCSGPSASAAGDHWNPGDAQHGGPDDPLAQRHAGDLGNITADDTGMVDESIESEGLLENGVLAVVGRAIIVHANSDDLASEPSGMSGDPVACGVIRTGTETSSDGASQADPEQPEAARAQSEDRAAPGDPVG